MDLSMDLWHSNYMKVILHNFAKNHCFWTLWALDCVDFISFSCIDSVHMAYNQATIKPRNLRKCSKISEKYDRMSIFAVGVL